MSEVDLTPFLAEGSKCKIAQLAMTEEQRESFNGAMRLPSKQAPTRQAVRVLKSWGFDVGRDSLTSHRNGECSCYDD